ncbi:amino acid adenylation domain-containing protein [Plectonema radiosum NIES-515]|uniref:Amino acid adenylation domain-containing protein n=1 Tax=Plectonema radiosum NIES-515 TaxID=2986073 RepID=A0ABT3AS83_9CYAN|nr:non-ribosomal peptide synthetase [Plectonema radiosum]MCV3211983.1 amino acid adenylation domain-containing protein [Plectonema radiosum NIES-515]
MILSEFLQEISIKGWKLWSEDGRLRYRAPNNEATSSVLEQLKENKAEILNLLQEQPNLLQVYPLSWGQRALWFLWQLAPESPAYNVAFNCRICSDVDVAALEKVFQVLSDRYPILRSSFPNLGTEPIQQVNLEQAVDFQQIDATNSSEEELKSLVFAAYESPFDLERGPVMRVRLFTRSQQEHILLLVIHHIVGEGWSIGILLDELKVLYPAFRTGREVTLPPPVHSHQDYVRWQKTIIESAEGERLWNYWQQQLAGELPVLNLPTDRPRPMEQTYNGASYPLYLSETLSQKLKELAQSERTTLYTILLAAFQVLLHRYTDQNNILVGCPTASRYRPEFTQIVGYLVNPVVMRADLSENPSFREFLAQVRNTVLAAIEHQDYPFPLIVERLQPRRDISRSPIFQACFVLQKLQQTPDVLKLYSSQVSTAVEWGGLVLKPYEMPQQEGQFDLTLEIADADAFLVGVLKYNADLFNEDAIARMTGHFQTLLEGIVTHPELSIRQLPLLSEKQKYQLLVEWNDTECEYPTDKCIHQLFEEQVEKTPNALAVVFEKQQLTYQQLNQRANQLAYYLQSLGVKPEVLVGICVERSVEMVVGLLGILKAGGAYVPLDPTYPQERLSYMLADSGVEVLLTQESLVESLPSHTAQVVTLDTDWDAIAQHSQNNLDAGVSSDNLAYVIYTSGSTGQPKGVQITHQNLVHSTSDRLKYYQNYQKIVNGFLLLSSFAFDSSVAGIFWTLCCGGKLILPQEGLQREIPKIIDLITHHEVSHFLCLPSLYTLILAQSQERELVPLKVIIVAGEACSSNLVKQHWQQLPESYLFNEYGPTEATVWSTVYYCQSPDIIKVPIGCAIANTQIYILDADLQPVPIGVRGEIYIGGPGLARGYLHRPDLTQEKFIPNPFKNSKYKRLYKTGDLARYLPNQNIEYLGRIDNQVKIRGFRIELGEIEAVLNQHPDVNSCVTIVREDIPGNKRLVAYVVTRNESLTTYQLREFLRQKLPEYMVPSAFVVLDTLPLTPNGKIDRSSLPATDGEITREHEYVAPSTAIEQILTNIWQELLLKEKVSIHDNFFEIGGDSILSIQVVSRAKNSGVKITPKQIFQNQTIAELATVANTTVSVTAQQGIVTGVAPLTPIQHWFLGQNPEEAHHYNQSVLLQIPKRVQSELIELAWKKLIEHHDALRLRFTSEASEHKQINQSKDDRVPFSVVDLSSIPRLSQPQALTKIATEFQASLNLSTGPIMQVVMFNLGSECDARLLIIIHHLVVDGVSWRILLSDLEIIYQQLVAQKPIQLSPKTTAFIDWAEQLNNYAQSEIIKQELEYWLNQPWSQTTPLPLDYAENTVGSAASVSVKLSVEETRTLLLSVNEAYNTQVNDILVSALVQTLAEWTGNSTVLIDLEGHGREELFADVDLSRTVGWFTSVFPVLLQLPKLDQPAEVIKSIKEQLRVIPNRGIGYGILRYLCETPTIHEQLQTIPTPGISFNYLGQFDQVQSQTGWKFAPESTGANKSSKQTRDHLLDIDALVVEGELQIDWTYSSNVHTRSTVENLAQSYIQAIRSIIEHCQSEDAFGYTPSDFPDAQLNQLEVDELQLSIKSKNIDSIYPLSPTQQGMLFHSLYAPESGVYFEQLTLNLQGNINVAAFESAWQKVVDRHSILRTFFVWENRQTPLQVVLKQVDLPWSNLNWLSLSPTLQQQQFLELLQTQREHGVQFNQAPLMKCTLIKLSDDSYKFIWSFHHILMDGWCLPIIFKEVLSFYEAELRGETCYLPTPSPYRNYIAWLNSQDKKAASEFWRQTLHDFSAPTPLLVDKTQYQNQPQDSNYFELELRLSAELSRELQYAAQQHHVTLATIIQAAWAILLSRYSGEKDIVFGVTVSGRTPSLSGVENMVGLFINTLPLRLLISPQEQLIPWLEQIQQLMLELQHYSYTPLVDIQAMSEISGGMPLFESIVVFENYPVNSSLFNQNGSLQLSEIKSFEQTNYPLTVVAVPGEQLLIKISYDTVRFEEDAIARMLGHLQTIFSAIVENPQQTVGELPLLSEAERHQLLVEWNDTECEYPTDKCIHQLFEEQVEKTPNALAVVFEKEQLTYQQLNQRANQLAHHLQSLGVKPEVLVGICVERSVEMVVGLLGILKAGGAYVPLDPTYPQERLSYMLADSDVEVLLTQESLLESLPSHTAQVVTLDTDWDAIAQHSQKNLDAGVSSDNLAYVIYTSGSTGQPKGVLVEHRNVVRLFAATQPWYHFNANDVWTNFHSIAFDFSVWEIWGALFYGGRLVIVPYWISRDPKTFYDLLCSENVTVLNQTPSAFCQLISVEQSDDTQPQLSLRLVIFGGEALELQSLKPWFERHGDQSPQLVNMYGITETTVHVTYRPLTIKDLNSSTSVIGCPIADLQMYILDDNLQPVPIGVKGQMYVGGYGLARGYLNRQQLTTERFISNPFNDQLEGRLYQTGDLARYLPNGDIEYLGRIDDQVKVRGFRIELGEVEAVLNKHPQLSQAVVTVQGNAANEKRLVGYVIPKQSEIVTTEQLRSFLLQKLPTYMIPSAFVTLESLPLTPNQKIDRRALPIPDLEPSRSDEYVVPRNPTEEIIANIFASVLKLEQVGIYNNFFELGGHSLLATQVVSRLRSSFQVEVPLRTLFETPTVAELAQAIWALRQTASGIVVPRIEAVTMNTESLPLSWAQERLWFLDQLESDSATYNMPAALQISGALNVEALEQALTEIIQRHSVLRTSFATVNGTPMQAIATPTAVTIPVVDLRPATTMEQPAWVQSEATQEAQQPFDLANGSPIRFKLLQLAEQSHVLLVTLHHIVFDAWSISIFVRELIALYEAALHQQPCVLPALPIQYTDFACWQRQWLQGEILETQLSYWKQQLGGNLPVLQLPIDYPHSPTQNYQGAQQVLRLPKSVTTAVKTLSRQEGVTVFMTLLAAFKVLLSRHTGQEDIIVGSPIAGRNHLGTEELIGCFLNTLPLRTDLSGNPSFRQLLTKVREVTLSAYSHQDIPFEKLVEELRPERSLSRHPLFDVTFNTINTPEVALEIPGLTFEPLELTQLESKFFLTVYVQEVAEELNIIVVYRQNLFSSERMTVFLEQFEHLVQQIVAEPERSLQSYSLITPLSRSLLPDPSAGLDQPHYEPVTALFAAWAQQAPEQSAIRQNGQTWTYQELSQSAHTIAEVLLSCGVQPGDVVAVCGSRSFGLIASMLGVFFSGAVLLLLDLNLPTHRQQLMIEEAEAKYLLNVDIGSKQVHLTESFLEIIDVDPQTATTILPKTSCCLPTLTPEHRAYIFFTSGSTGTPKGVLGTHKGISHFLDWQRQTFEIGTFDRVAQLTSLTFDAILRDVFLPLTSGATLCLPDSDSDLGSDWVLSWLEKEQITVVHTVPPVAQSWLTQVPFGIHLRSLRWIFFSGEPLTGTFVQQWRQTFPEAGQVVNLYGATETTMVKCFYRVPSEIPTGIMPGGWALPYTQVLVLNSTKQLCGIGEIGEIIIRTPFRTLGYINATSEQQQRFVPNHDGSDPEDLFYYTGDKGRYRPDGAVEVLGRLDDQIKIHGIRIQPAEIETVLNEHPAVAESVVIATQLSDEDKRLVAYVVAKLNQILTLKDLRYFLKQRLPEFLMPSAFVVLDALPLTASGKVNRRALPTPSQEVGSSASNIKPRTPTEEVIVSIFAAILKIQHLSVDDNFFELGGHSLLATQVASRLREALKVNLPLRTLFEAPTPAELAVAIEKIKVTGGAEIDTPKITKISRDRHRVQVSSQEELTLPDAVRQEIFKPESKH